jgi:hypothetical protein
MGNNASTLSTIKSFDIYDKLQMDIDNLIYKHQFWTDERVCKKLEVMYGNDILQITRSDILNISARIGIKYDKTDETNILCSKIIQHYSERVKILAYIKIELKKIYRKVLTAQSGPICKKVDGVVDDFFMCNKLNGIWISSEQYANIISNIKLLPSYSIWITHVENLDKSWLKYMKKIKKVVEMIKQDTSNSLDTISLIDLRLYSEETIRKMNYVCDIYCLLLINFS